MKISEIEWGNDSAEQDDQLLEYFITSDALTRLSRKTKSIVIGRKGTGKSALVTKLHQIFSQQQQTHVVLIKPNYNAINNILNESSLKSGFGNEVFFQHSWMRQIYLDCLGAIGKIQTGFSFNPSYDFARKVAISQGHAPKDLVENITEILTRIRVKAGSLGELGILLEKVLKDVGEIEALERHLIKITEDNNKIVVLIDDLDLGWDNSEIANNFLLGLLSAVNHIMARNKKIHAVVFLREDIYNIILGHTQHSDKYRNVERIKWDKEKLVSVLNARINYNFVKNGKSNIADAAFYEVFPANTGAAYTDNWLIERTLSRPRELIQFARIYTESVEGDLPSVDEFKNAEPDYSAWKLADICSEYKNQYPDLSRLTSYWASQFRRRKYHLKKSELDEMIKRIFREKKLDHKWYSDLVEKQDVEGFLNILFEVGLIGDFVLGGSGGSKCLFENAAGDVFRRGRVPRWVGCGPRNTVPGRRPLSGVATRPI